MIDNIYNEISENDIAILNKYGETLGETLTKFGGDIDNLKAYIKWLYKYGGTGSKYGGNGEGGGSSKNWSIVASVDEQMINNNSILLDNSKKTYTLTLTISRPGSGIYNVSVSYNGKLITLSGSNKVTLSAENNTYSTQISLSENGKTLTINATEMTEMEIKSTQCTCIMDPSNFSLSFVDNSDKTVIINNGIIYRDNIIRDNKGFNLKVNHELFINASEIILSYNIVGQKILSGTIQLSDFGYNEQNKFTLFDIFDNFIKDKEISECVGYYAISIKLSYNYNGNNVEELSVSFSILPSTIFLNVVPNINNAILYPIDPIGDEYEEDDLINIYKFASKNVVLKLTGYLGANPMNATTLNLNININDTREINTILTNNVQNSIILNLNGSEEDIIKNNIKFTVTNPLDHSQIYMTEYYIFINKQDNSISWYPNDATPQLTSNFKFTQDIEDSYNLFNNLLLVNKNFHTAGYIEFNNTDNYILYNSNNNVGDPVRDNDFMISFGIQYSEVNKNTNKIMTIKLSNGNDITIYQDNITFLGNKYQIYIPEEENYEPSDSLKYNLFTLYKRKLTEDNDKYYNISNAYEFILYLNGELEQGINESYIVSDEGFYVSQIIIYEGNYSFNLFEISYFSHPNDYENITSDHVRLYLNDDDVIQYYYMYKSLCYTMNNSSDNDFNEELKNFLIYYNNISELFKTIDYTYTNEGKTEIRSSVIKLNNVTSDDTFNSTMFNINASGVPNLTYDVPIVILKVDLNGKSVDYFFNDFFNKSYEDNLKEAEKYNVSVNWYNENDTQSISSTSYSNVRFILSLQGTSTGSFKSKNFNLTSSSSNVDETALWTPKFLFNDKDSFLPEETFTFKADVVDSTHANNTSIGLFVNKNTTKFADAQKNDSKYGGHIKNCLMGFPILVFFAFSDSEGIYDYYYMGIYNCNLGRDSLLNLGYYDIKNALDIAIDNGSVDTKMNEGFGVYTINSNDYQPISDGINNYSILSVAEVQNSINYFDFSQYDDSILFDSVNGAGQIITNGMFGDYYPTRGVENTKSKLKKFVEGVSLAGGYLFETRLGKNLSESDEDNYGYKYGYSAHRIVGNTHYWLESTNSVPNYKYKFKQRLGIDGAEFIYDSTIDGNNIQGTQKDLFDLIGVVDEEGETPKGYKFNDNNNTIFGLLDYTSVVEYYTICMAFGLVDSVIKNLNLKSFKESGPFYAAFYDMDTANGRDNAGIASSPFAYSDYWTKFNDKDIIYRDFYPDTNEASNLKKDFGAGYDIPSSYLFAIAKYAYLDVYQITGYNFSPRTVWAKYRENENSSLSNADTFINNYFGKNLDKIPKYMFNMNYRYKYFQRHNSSFDTKNKQPFHGRGKFYLKNWLTKRLHLLDAYFNINDFKSIYKTYDITTNIWNYNIDDPLMEYEINKILPAPISLSNPDIYILKNIFSNELNGAVSLVGSNQSATIKALDYSPMTFKYPSSSIFFLCEYSDTEYSFSGEGISSQAVLAIRFGGSIAWTYASSLTPFITNDRKLTLDNAKYLENINVPSGNLSTLSLNNVKSLKDININSQTASCTIDSNNGFKNAASYPNLRTINISNSQCTLDIANLPVKTINMRNVNTYSDDIKEAALTGKTYNIVSCDNLSNVNINGMYAQNLTINPVWNNNIFIENASIRKIVLTANIEKYGESTITITNNEAIKELILSDFTYIHIENCPNLKTISITQNNNEYKVKRLEIINCNRSIYDDNSIEYKPEENYLDIKINNINVSNNGEINLSLLSSLNELSLNGTIGFSKIILPDNNVILLNSCFANTELKTLDNENTNATVLAIIGGDSIFMNTKYLIPGGQGKIDYKFGILNTQSSLSNMFAHTSTNIKYSSDDIITNVYDFFNNLIIYDANTLDILDTIPNEEGLEGTWSALDFVYDISNMFYNQDISIKTISNASNYDGFLARLTNVVNIKNAFYGNRNFNVLTPSMLKSIQYEYSFAENSSSLSLSDFINNLTTVYINTFCDLLPKIKDTFIASINSPVTLSVLSTDGTLIQNLKLKEFFGENPLNNITEINGLNFSNPELDFDDLFDILPNVKTITYSFGINPSNKANNLNSCKLNTLTNLTINNSFKFTSVDEKVDLYNLINWNNISKIGIAESNTIKDLLLFDKYITYDDFEEVLQKINDKQDYIDYIFQQCSFINNEHTNEFKIPSTIGEIRSINNTFKYIKMLDENNNEFDSIKLTSNTFPANHKITAMNYAFYGVTLECGLPVNLFNLRKSKGVNYLSDTYTKQISSMTACFSNVKIINNPYWDATQEELNHALLKLPEGHYVESISPTPSSSVKFVYNNDKYNIQIYNNENGTSVFSSSGGEDIYNRQLKSNNSINKYILPYDIFYGTTNNTYIDQCFANSEFEGIMTPNIYNDKLNDIDDICETTSSILPNKITGTFENLNIIPRKLNTDELYKVNDEYIENIIRTDIYVYLPKYFINFRNNISLEKAFNFNINIPNDNISNGIYTYVNYYLMFDKTLSSNVQLLRNMFADSCHGVMYTGIQETDVNKREYNLIFNNSLYDIRFGYIIDDEMYMKAKEGITVQETVNNDGNIITQNVIYPISRKYYDGVDISKFNNTDALLNGAFTVFLTNMLTSNPIRLNYNNGQKQYSPYSTNTGAYTSANNNPSVFNFDRPNKLFIMPYTNNTPLFNKFFIGDYSITSSVSLYTHQAQTLYQTTKYDTDNTPILTPTINTNITINYDNINITIINSYYNDGIISDKEIDINEIIEDPIILYWKRYHEENGYD